MSKLWNLTLATFLVLGLAVSATAQEDETFLEGTSSVGGHYWQSTGAFSQVGEWVSYPDIWDPLPDYSLDLFAGTGSLMSKIQLLYKNTGNNHFGIELNTDSYVDASANYRTFVHNFNKDLLSNLNAREQLPNGNPGGKQVYYTDYDPKGRYYIDYKGFDSDIEVDLPFMKQGKVYSNFDDQSRAGFKQETTIDHCAFCHVGSNRREINNNIKQWRTGVDGSLGTFTFNYEFLAQEFTDHTTAPNRHYDRAMHPVRGTEWIDPANGDTIRYGPEFSSRLIYDNSSKAYNRVPSSKKWGHHLGLKVHLPKENSLRGAYTYSKTENWWTGLQSKSNTGIASWVGKFGKKWRASARFMTYDTKVDDVFIDLPLYREGRPGQPLNFDWTRTSSLNRKAWQTDVDARYRFGKGGYLKLLWRHKEVDRDAMTQSQTSYINDNGTNIPIPSTPYANKSTSDKIKLTASKRVSRKSNVLAYLAYTNIDKPYMNPHGLCENGLNGQDYTLVGSPSTWYFQRSRYGNGTSLPSQSITGSLRGSHQFSSRTSLSAFLTGATEKNDQLNSYEFDRDLLTVGGNVWTAPHDKWMFTLGYTYNMVKSNAKLCPPIMDG